MTEEEKLKSLMNEKHRLEAQLDKVIMKIRALVYNFDKKIGSILFFIAFLFY
jgi:hypothetical protein